MAFKEKDCVKVRDVYEMTLERSSLTPEDVECAKKFTLGDLIVHAGFTLSEAQQFINFIAIEEKRHAALGFNVNKEKIDESKKEFINECNYVGMMAGLGPLSDEEVSGYHPEQNDMGGLSFEDSGSGEESGMIKSNLQSIASKAQSLHDKIGHTDDLPEWVQEKIAVADEMIDTIYDYLGYEYKS